MALGTITRVGNPTVFGDKKVGFLDVTLPTSYTTGGDTLAVADCGLALTIDLVLVSQRNGVIVEPLYQTDGSVKLKCVYPTGGATAPATATAPVAAGTSGAVTQPTISAPVATGGTATIPAGGTTVTSSSAQPAATVVQPTISAPVATGGAVANPTVALTAGIGKEVASTTNLSALGTIRILYAGA